MAYETTKSLFGERIVSDGLIASTSLLLPPRADEDP
jgi:hypothetical protein